MSKISYFKLKLSCNFWKLPAVSIEWWIKLLLQLKNSKNSRRLLERNMVFYYKIMSILWNHCICWAITNRSCMTWKVPSKITLNLSEMFLTKQPELMMCSSLNFKKILFPDNPLTNFCINPKFSRPDLYQTSVKIILMNNPGYCRIW